ncbi:DUF819 family protein [Robiginitalea sp. IMCC43444]|uniref:DUF819 family protein n=1 Tax=Robiginitalea sp. IMCC43444 TaxID=3459121 RepID=UPI004042725A
MEFTETPLYIISALALILLISNWISNRPFFKAFGIALMVILVGALFSNLGLIPSAANPVYNSIFEIVAPAALFLLLLDVNLLQLKKTGVPILLLFVVGSLGTVAGVFIASQLISDGPLFQGMYNALAGMFTGTYTGGSINFNAVALHYEVMDNGLLYTAAVAADNVLTTIWFFVTITLPVLLQRFLPYKKFVAPDGAASEVKVAQDDERAQLNIGSLSFWIALSGGGLLLASWLTELLETALGLRIPFMITLTTLAILLAQIPALHRLKGNMFLGSWAIYLFLAVVGAFCDIGALASAGQLAVLLLLFVLITVLVHGLIVFGFSYLAGYGWELAAIASQANVGGGTTAMALAKNFKRDELILPAIIIGSFGNALGTYLGFMVAAYL